MENVIYRSSAFSCECNNKTFTSSGETSSDDYMVEDDELTCTKCGIVYVVACDDGYCELYTWSKK